jgi:hypothetical protein
MPKLLVIISEKQVLLFAQDENGWWNGVVLPDDPTDWTADELQVV